MDRYGSEFRPVLETSTCAAAAHNSARIGHHLTLLYSVGGQTHLDRLGATIADQIKLDHVAGVEHRYARVLITDINRSLLTDAASNFFDDIVCDVEAFVLDPFTGKKYFSLAKMRNASIQYAAQHGLKWILLCDADTVIADYTFDEPDGNFGFPEVYWRKLASESIFLSLERVRNPNDSTFSGGNSWFLIRSELFERLQFDENFYGYGFEDREFGERAHSFRID